MISTEEKQARIKKLEDDLRTSPLPRDFNLKISYEPYSLDWFFINLSFSEDKKYSERVLKILDEFREYCGDSDYPEIETQDRRSSLIFSGLLSDYGPSEFPDDEFMAC